MFAYEKYIVYSLLTNTSRNPQRTFLGRATNCYIEIKNNSLFFRFDICQYFFLYLFSKLISNGFYENHDKLKFDNSNLTHFYQEKSLNCKSTKCNLLLQNISRSDVCLTS